MKTPQFSAGIVRKIDSGVFDRRNCGRQRKLRKAIEMPRLLDTEPRRRVPIANLTAEMNAKIGGVKERERRPRRSARRREPPRTGRDCPQAT